MHNYIQIYKYTKIYVLTMVNMDATVTINVYPSVGTGMLVNTHLGLLS